MFWCDTFDTFDNSTSTKQQREREESAAEPAVVKDSDAPAAKKLKVSGQKPAVE